MTIVDCFWRKDVLLIKYRHQSNDFFVKNRKKNGHPHFFFVYNIVWFWQNWLFYQIRARQQEVFHQNLDKNVMRELYFWEKGCFIGKIWAIVQCFFSKNGRFRITYRHESIVFFVKSREKRHLIYFLAHNIL